MEVWKFGSLEILEYANDLYFSHIYLNWVVWKCESLETCKRALPFSHLSNFSQGWKILATQPWAPYRKGEQAPVTPKSVTGGKREGMGEKKLPSEELPLLKTLQGHAQSTCKNASTEELMKFRRICVCKKTADY